MVVVQHVLPWLLPRISTSMRAPSGGLQGWMAMKLMEHGGNDVREVMGIQRLQLKATDTFVEIGPGHGFGLRSLGSSDDNNNNKNGGQQQVLPERIIGIEISSEFQKKLQQLKAELPYGDKIEIYNTDCRDMSFLESSSVDKVFAMNVVYFLDPLAAYLQEIHRVVKPGGCVVFGGVFSVVPNAGAFVNAKEESIADSMDVAGFDVTSMPVFLNEGDSVPLYTELKGIKR